jgi:hypothetical protein
VVGISPSVWIEHRALAPGAAAVALAAQRVDHAEHPRFRAAQRHQRAHARRRRCGVVLVVVQRAPEHRAVDSDHPADGHGDVIDFVDRHVVVLSVTAIRIFGAAAVTMLANRRIGRTRPRCVVMPGRQFRGERTG